MPNVVHKKVRIEFTADTATFDEIDEVIISGLAVGDGVETYLMFQRSVADGPDDWGVYLEYGDQANSEYEAISACRLSRERVEVDLSGRLGNLEGVEGFDVTLQVDDSTFQSFADGLTKVFRGNSILLVGGVQQKR